MDDRRSKPRLGINLEAVWERTGDVPAARLTNLSEGGCFLDTVGEVRSGEIVAFRVLMPDEDEWLYLEGEVRHHVKGIGFGVKFLELNQDQESKIRELMEVARESGSTTRLTADLVED